MPAFGIHEIDPRTKIVYWIAAIEFRHENNIISYGKLVTYMNGGTCLQSVRQIRRSEYPEYNLGNTRTAKLNILFGCTCEAS